MPQACGTHFVVTKTDGAIQSSADRISCSCSPSRFRNLNFFKVSKPEWQSTEGCVEERVPVAPCRQRCRRAFARATIQPSEMKTQSPSDSRGRALVRISNLPPWLSLLCMVIYIKEEPTMQISVSSTLTVYHDGQFWVGLAEHVEDGRYGVARTSSAQNRPMRRFGNSLQANGRSSRSSLTRPLKQASPRRTPSGALARQRKPLSGPR